MFQWKLLSPLLPLLALCFCALPPAALSQEPFEASPSFDSYVGACVLTKDDNPDIAEWVEYHQRLGVGRIYLYDHNSTAPQINDLQKHVTSGLVEYTFLANVHESFYSAYPAHYYAYNLCLEHWGPSHRWMLFLDADEFLVLKKGAGGGGAAEPPLLTFLRGYERYGGVGLNWVLYGSAGHVARPPGGAAQSYDKCDAVGDRHIKILAQPALTRRAISPHQFAFTAGHYLVTSHRRAVPGNGPYHLPVELDLAYVAHLPLRSRDDFARRQGLAPRGGARWAGDEEGAVGGAWDVFAAYDARAASVCPKLQQ